MDQPKSLFDLTSYKVNKSIEKNDIDKLSVPKEVEKKLQDKWVSDFLHCDEKIPDDF